MIEMDETPENDLNYESKIENARIYDSKEDLGSTIHIEKAQEICMEIEEYYLKELIEIKEKYIKLQSELIETKTLLNNKQNNQK